LFSVSSNDRKRPFASFLTGLILVAATAIAAFSPGLADGQEVTTGRESPETVIAEQRNESVLVQITGNSAVSDKILLDAAVEELNDFRSKGFKEADADDAAYQIELAYRRMGYRFAKVDYVVERQEGGGVKLVFAVQEGNRVQVADIVITGNQRIPKETLEAFFKAGDDGMSTVGNWFVESRVTDAVDEIREYYYEKGYLQCVVNGPQFSFNADNSTVTVQVSIEEGKVFLINELLFTGDLLPELTGQLKELRESFVGQPYLPRRTAYLLESKIAELYENKGYPDVKVEIGWDEGRAAVGEFGTGDTGEVVKVGVEARIESGPLVTISGIRITGNFKTSEEFIRSRLAMKEGDTYSAAKKRASFSDLYRTGLFSLVRISLVETETITQRQLLVEVEELPRRELSFELGWGSYEMLRGKVELRSKNFMGKGRVLSSSAAASLKSKDLSLGISDPWLLGNDLVLDLPVYYRTREEPSFDRAETGVSAVVSKHFTEEKVGVSLTYSLRYARQSDVSVDVGG